MHNLYQPLQVKVNWTKCSIQRFLCIPVKGTCLKIFRRSHLWNVRALSPLIGLNVEDLTGVKALLRIELVLRRQKHHLDLPGLWMDEIGARLVRGEIGVGVGDLDPAPGVGIQEGVVVPMKGAMIPSIWSL